MTNLRKKMLFTCRSLFTMGLMLVASCNDGGVYTGPPPRPAPCSPVSALRSGCVSPYEPPPPACAEGKDLVLLVDQLFLTDTSPDGTPAVDGWKDSGFNLDGLVSTKESTNLCKPRLGASKTAVYTDGLEGQDNSFGKNLVPILFGLDNELGKAINTEIASGKSTSVLRIPNLGGVTEPCATTSMLYWGADLGHSPLFDGNDEWPIDPFSLVTPEDPNSSKWTAGAMLYKENVIVIGVNAAHQYNLQYDLRLPVAGTVLVVPLRHAVVVIEMDPVTGYGTGRLGAIIPADELVMEIAKVASAFDLGFCDPNSPTLQSILNQLRQASDIMQDGSQDPTQQCDGISIGLRFSVKPGKLGPVAPPAMPPPDPCVSVPP